MKYQSNLVRILLLRSEIPSGMCAKLRTVAASNNRDHPMRSLSSSLFASTINCSPDSQALLEVTHQDHSIGITLLLLVRATYIYFVLRAHPVRGESYNQRNTTEEVATLSTELFLTKNERYQWKMEMVPCPPHGKSLS